MNNTKVLLVFYNPQNSISQKAETIINENTPSDIEVQYIDVHTNGKIALEFNVSIVPTFILLDEGVEIARDYGGLNKELFDKFINN